MKKSIKGFANLDYLTMTNVPVRKTTRGQVLDISLAELERLAALAILEYRIPVRGLEVKLFRSLMGLSLADFGEELGYKDTTILNWEKQKKKQLSLANEIAVKLLVAEHLGLNLSPIIHELRSTDKPKNIRISAA